MKKTNPIIMKGLPVSKGVAIGKCHIEHGRKSIEENYIEKKLINKELKRIDSAMDKTILDLTKVKNKISPSIKKNIGLFLDTHILLINDKVFVDNIKGRIKNNLNSCEWALYSEYLEIKESFDNIEDSYIKQRIEDVNHVVNMILANLDVKKKTTKGLIKDFSNLIIITDDLSPADVLLTYDSKGLGIISEYGGRTSHSSILTRSLELPSIVGVKNILKICTSGDLIILDGHQGLIIINPNKKIIENYKKLQKNSIQNKKVLSEVLKKKSITLDNEKIEIMANLELPHELKIINNKNIDGIGLFRTEYLYTDRDDFPTENEQYKAYKNIVEKMKGNPVIFRTLDIGADKEIPENIKTGSIARNPALGLRGIRYSLSDELIFCNQIKAILRAGAHGKVKIMLPMITTLSEITSAKKLISKAKSILESESKKFESDIEIGIMVEVPSCAVLADRFAKEVDFLSIGTNDLVQYTLAIDRVDDEVNYLYDQSNLAILSLLKTIIDAGTKNKIPVSLCGEMAADVNYTRLLLGMGLKSFSMHPSAIPEIKNIIINSNVSKLAKPVNVITECGAKAKRAELLTEINKS